METRTASIDWLPKVGDLSKTSRLVIGVTSETERTVENSYPPTNIPLRAVRTTVSHSWLAPEAL